MVDLVHHKSSVVAVILLVAQYPYARLYIYLAPDAFAAASDIMRVNSLQKLCGAWNKHRVITHISKLLAKISFEDGHLDANVYGPKGTFVTPVSRYLLCSNIEVRTDEWLWVPGR